MSALAAAALLAVAALATAAAPPRDAPALAAAAAPLDGRGAPPAPPRFAAAAPPREAREPGLALVANVTEVSSAPRWVAVRWAGVREPSLDDWISLHYADAAPGAAPIKFQLAALARSHLATGAGELAFRLLPAREDCAFQFLRGGLAAPRVAARTARIVAAAPNAPLQGRLAPTGRPGEVAISWTTRDARRAPAARWRAAAAGAGVPFLEAAAAASTTYTRAEMCGQPANSTGWADPGFTHTAVMAGLAADTLYSYTFGDASSGEPFSAPATFRAPPAPAAPAALLLVADLGQAEPDGALAAGEQGAAAATHARLAADAATGQYHLLVHAGDISYARGFASQWENFFDAAAGAMRAVPHAYALGNHEHDWETGTFFKNADSGGECGVPYRRRLLQPGAPPGADVPPWYALDIGALHLLVYSTEHDAGAGSPQRAFLAADLGAVDRARTPWVALVGHRPMYIDSVGYSSDQEVAAALRASLEPLLAKYKVDLTISGHHHSWQRTCPVLNSTCVTRRADGSAAAPVHLIVGNGGAGLSFNTHFRAPPQFERVLLRHGHARLAVNATHLAVEAVSAATGAVMDAFELVKPRVVGIAAAV